MARPGLSYEEVEKAIIKLESDDIYPTIEQIRRLTGTGSSTTIANHLKTWRTQQHHNRYAFNDELPKELQITIQSLWSGLKNTAEEQVRTIQTEFDRQYADLMECYEQLQLKYETLDTVCTQAQADNHELTASQLALQQQLAEMKEALQSEIKIKEKLSTELDWKQIRINELKQAHQQLQQNLEHYRESSREQRQQDLARFDQQKIELDHEIKQLKHAALELKERNYQLINESTTLNTQAQSLKYKLDELNQEYNELKNHTSSLHDHFIKEEHMKQHWQEQYQLLKKQYDTEITESLENKKLLSSLQAQSEQTCIQLERLIQDKHALQQEKNALMNALIKNQSLLPDKLDG